MLVRKKSNYLMIGIISVLVIVWLLYSFLFYQTYDEAKIFATEGAQSIIQILEILNYRGEQLKPYFIVFFTLTSLSFLFITYLFLFIKKNNLKTYSLIFTSLFVVIILGINIANKLFLFLFVLIAMSLLVILSITLTVKHLYMGTDVYEKGDVIRTKGPFESEKEAQKYVAKELKDLEKQIKSERLYLESSIYSEDSSGYYVELYLEDIRINGESNEENEENFN